MKQLTGNQVRQMFLDYFESQGHTIEPSQSLIPHDDPTLLWVNAGVTVIKKYFDGSMKPDNPRIANAQKSLRTNDIENVGKTARHQTFFEMLGNFSVGDYFKKEAISFAWEFLTSENWLAFDKDKLYITVHDRDQEAYDYWVNTIGVKPDHMLKTPENFWEIGKGPCGPDSEIFYDRGSAYDPEGKGVELFYKELENDRYIEIWNLVFSQYNAMPETPREEYKELPQRNIDTGMGLERIVSIIQNGETNFDTDLFLPIINAIGDLAKVPYQENKMAYRVIADHIRTVTFALADGALFDNVGRGYVLRRILRRAVRYGKQIGMEQAFMYQLVDTVSDCMKEYYAYLPEKVTYIQDLVLQEEEAFHKTLVHGEKLLANLMASNTTGILSGKDAFMLYDTYGFPLELTVEIAQESNVKVDEKQFEKELQLQKERSRSSRSNKDSMATQNPDLLNFMQPSTFIYDPSERKGQVIGLFRDGKQVTKITDYGELILDTTTFYAEMGGQCADTGTMFNENTQMEVLDVQTAPHKQHLHYIEMKQGQICVGDKVTLAVDYKKRQQITANHTATHMLQQALKEVIGSNISQAGSYVDERRLRFDFTHFTKITKEQLRKVEQLVNQKIRQGLPVSIASMPKEEALEKGATAIFGEKYGDIVRVVSVDDFSIELCGGCHVTNSQQIGLCKIVSEESIGSGIRRIEAVTGYEAYRLFDEERQTVDEIANLLQLTNRKEVTRKLQAVLEKQASLQEQVSTLTDKINQQMASNKINEVQVIHDIPVLYIEEELESAKAKQMVFTLRDQLQSGVVLLLAKDKDRYTYFVALTKDIVARGKKAGDIIKTINQMVDGRGGGKPELAQGGCGASAPVELIKENLASIL